MNQPYPIQSPGSKPSLRSRVSLSLLPWVLERFLSISMAWQSLAVYLHQQHNTTSLSGGTPSKNWRSMKSWKKGRFGGSGWRLSVSRVIPGCAGVEAGIRVAIGHWPPRGFRRYIRSFRLKEKGEGLTAVTIR
eukprot:647946-Amorphochlora_amoeboformis.AAC.1